MSTYLKNIAGYKHNQLKSKSYDEIQEMFNKEMKRMLQNINREETLWKLVKTKHGNTMPEEAYERVLLGDLKVMFEPDVEISAAGTKVNDVGIKVTTAERLQLLKEFLLTEG
ncbi:hypothetical protein Tco_0211129 [Tanacetum coccineum]